MKCALKGQLHRMRGGRERGGEGNPKKWNLFVCLGTRQVTTEVGIKKKEEEQQQKPRHNLKLNKAVPAKGRGQRKTVRERGRMREKGKNPMQRAVEIKIGMTVNSSNSSEMKSERK